MKKKIIFYFFLEYYQGPWIKKIVIYEITVLPLIIAFPASLFFKKNHFQINQVIKTGKYYLLPPPNFKGE